MVVLRTIRDQDIDFGSTSGRIQVRGHPVGGFKGVLVIKRDTCPYCVRSLQALQNLASQNASMHPVYIVDLQDPACALALQTWKPQGVPFFVRVNKLGRVDTEEFTVDWTNPDNLLSAIKRE